MPGSTELTQTLYEMAMSIGASLNLGLMLENSLPVFIKKLNCAAGGVYLFTPQGDGNFTLQPACVITGEHLPALDDHLPQPLTPPGLADLRRQLPLFSPISPGQTLYMLDLPDVGLLVLLKAGPELEPQLLNLLEPLLQKLANACLACLQTRQLERAHQEALETNLKLTQTSAQLQQSRNDLLRTLQELRTVAGQNQTLLDGIPDAMFFVNNTGEILDYKAGYNEFFTDLPLDGTLNPVKIQQLFPVEVEGLILTHIGQTLDSRKLQVFEFEDTAPPEPRYFEVRLVPSRSNEVMAIVRNITERKRVELALRNAEARLRTVVNAAPIILFALDQAGTFTLSEGKGLSKLGRAPGQVVGQSIFAVYANNPDILENMRRTLAGETRAFISQVAGLTFDTWYEPIKNQAGDTVGVVGVAYDITERQQAEEALQQSEARTRAIINTAADGIITIDEHGTIQSFNPAAERIFGCTAPEAIGQKINHFMPSPYREEHDDYIAAYLKTGQKKVIGAGREVLGRRTDGTVFPMYLAVGEVRLGSGHLFTGIIQDITERKRVEQTLSAVLDTVGEAIITINAAGVIMMVNQQVQDIWGYSQSELIGNKLTMLMPHAYRQAHTGGMERYLKTKIAHVLGQRIEIEGLKKNGEVFPIELLITETQLGEQLLFTAAIRDITRRRELDRMRDDFVATVTHELRTPLTGIIGWTDTLLDGRPGPLTDRQQRALQTINKSSERLQGLIEEILTVSRIQQGTLKLDMQPFMPAQAVENIHHMVMTLAQAKAINLEINNTWPPDTPFQGDQNRLEQVMANLIGNAIKFTPQHGRVTVQSSARNGAWHFVVTDTGIGIPANDIPRLFERFFRASNASQAQIQGTGLGLYVCKAIIEGHGGQIGLESQLEQGTTIWFTVPQR